MKTIPEVLAEIDRRANKLQFITNENSFIYDVGIWDALLELKQFILSGECEHEWIADIRRTAGNVCKKCGALK